MRNPAYPQFDYPFLIAESPALEKCKAASTQSGWTEGEIAEIRAVLHKLSVIRILNPTDAEDLVQDTLLTMLIKHPGCELEKGLLVWTMGILRKKVGNYYRKAQRFASLSEQDPGTGQPVYEPATAASPESKLFHEELKSLIDDMLRQFPAAQRETIELLISGLDSGEIVRRLHPERYQNVINRIHRGRKKLAKELAKYGYGPQAKAGMRKMKRCTSRK